MIDIHPAALEHELKRWMRPDAHRYIRSDWRRFAKSGSALETFYKRFERKYSPDQPRVPRGQPEGGQWTSGAGSGRNDPRVVSDATPDPLRSGAQYAQNRPRGSGIALVIINGVEVEPTPGQAARLAVVEAQANAAIRRVQELDPSWKPTPSLYESVEGRISSYQAEAQEALNRVSELQRVGIGPGPFAVESFPARSSSRNYNSQEIQLNNSNGARFGCHTCGTHEPGTFSGNFVLDHQPPTALNFSGASQRIYPQCLFCSLRQGGWVNSLKRRN